MDTYRSLYPTIAECTFFLNTHRTYTKIDCTLGYKTNLNTFKRIEIIQSVSSDHKGLKLEIINRKLTGKSPNTWKLNKTHGLISMWVLTGLLMVTAYGFLALVSPV